tara:strand:+ start:878 stop:1657 length:780 start_codon:yes stop_codon:yes gene_type:complete
MAPYKQPYGFKGGPGGPGDSKKSLDEEIKVDLDEGKFGLPVDDEVQQGEFGKVGRDRDIDTKKTKKERFGDLKTAIIQSNFVGKRRKLKMALKNTFYGTKYGKDENKNSIYKDDTPWKRYRSAVKDFKQKQIKEKTDPFSKERRLAKKDLRGRFDASGKRLSFKNKMQQKYLVGRRRGKDGNTVRGFHTPNIPNVQYAPAYKRTFAEKLQDRRNQKQIDAGGVKIGGCTPSGSKFTGQYRANVRDYFGHGSQCGPKGEI